MSLRRETLQSERENQSQRESGRHAQVGFFPNSPGLPGPVLAMTAKQKSTQMGRSRSLKVSDRLLMHVW